MVAFTLSPGIYEVVVARAGSPIRHFPALKVTAGNTLNREVLLGRSEP